MQLTTSKKSISYEQALSKIEHLEHTLNSLKNTFDICDELLILLNELPYGQTLINLATNDKKLKYLIDYVLPRRKQALIEIESDNSMPKDIKNSISTRELKLIKKTTNEIQKRSQYHQHTLTYLLSLHS